MTLRMSLSPGGPCTASGRSRPRRSKVLSRPAGPSQWSAWKWVRNTSSTSGRPMERTSWRWAPSPQSKRRRSPPRRTSRAGMPRRAVGTEPAVPAKKTSRSIAASLVQRHQLEADPLCLHPRNSHRVTGRAAPLGRAAGIEDCKPVVVFLVEGEMGVPEHDRVRRGKPTPQAREAAPRGPGVVDKSDARAIGLHDARVGQLDAQVGRVDVAVHGCDGAAALEPAQHGALDEVAGVEDEVRAAQAPDARDGKLPAPPGKV